MSLFLDNDVLAKLASWDMLEDGVRACGCEMADVLFLRTARYALRIGKDNCKYSGDAQARMKALMATGKECTYDPIDQDGQLPKVAGIDAGEAILIAQAAQVAGSLLTTGDKKCIRAAATEPSYSEAVKNLAGRVLCLEQVLLRIIDRLGFEEVKKRVVGSKQIALDTAVYAAFGSGEQAEETNACWNLESRVKSLTAEAGGMLAGQTYRFVGHDGDDGAGQAAEQ